MKYSTARHQVSELAHGQLWAFFALIVYTPLPLASNRPWALALLGVLTGCLFLWNLWRPAGRSMAFVWQSAKTPLILIGLWIMLLAIQLVPLPDAWINMLDHRAVFTTPGLSAETISIDPYSTRLYLAKACILAMVFWLAVTLIYTRRRIEWLAKVVVISGLLQALVGVVITSTGTTFQLFFVELVNPRAHGTFVYPNHYAGYLELTLAMGIGLMIAKLDGRISINWRQRLHGWLAVIISGKAMLRLALIIMVVGLVASRSRMGNAAFFASLLIIGVLTVIFTKRASCKTHDRQSTNMMHSTILFIMSLIVLDVVIIGGMVGVEKVVQRIEHTNLQTQSSLAKLSEVRLIVTPSSGNVQPIQVYHNEQSVEERSEAALPSLQIIRDFPWLGTGGGTFYLSFPHYRPSEVREYYNHPHNDFIEFASEVGLTGLLLLAAMVAHSAWQSLMLLVQGRDQLARGMAFASLMGMTSLLIHGAVDFNFQNPANAMLFLILLSLPYVFKSLLKR
jgi:hypothetical protein